MGKHTGDDVGGHLLKEIDRIVEEHFVEQALKLGVVYHSHEVGLRVGFEVGKDLCREILWQHAEDKESVRRLQLLHNGRDIDHVHFDQDVTQR